MQICARFGYQRFPAHAIFFALEKMQKKKQTNNNNNKAKPNLKQKTPLLYVVLLKTGNLWTVYES